jgi:hypothetical protein
MLGAAPKIDYTAVRQTPWCDFPSDILFSSNKNVPTIVQQSAPNVLHTLVAFFTESFEPKRANDHGENEYTMQIVQLDN